MKTYKFRLKNKGIGKLSEMASDVNFVWNFCNDVAIQYLDKKGIWLSGFDLNRLTPGCTSQLSINSSTIQAIEDAFEAPFTKQNSGRKPGTELTFLPSEDTKK